MVSACFVCITATGGFGTGNFHGGQVFPLTPAVITALHMERIGMTCTSILNGGVTP